MLDTLALSGPVLCDTARLSQRYRPFSEKFVLGGRLSCTV